VVAAGSRTGSAICLALLIVLPLFAYLRGVISVRSLIRVSLLAAAAAFLCRGRRWQTIWDRLQEPIPMASAPTSTDPP